MANKFKKLLVAGSLVTSLFIGLTACDVKQESKPDQSATPNTSVVSVVPSSQDVTPSSVPQARVLQSVTAVSNKASYEYGNEQLDLTVNANYSDGTSETITDYQVSGYNAKSTGEQNITITYQGKTCSLKVKVDNPVLVNITATTNKEAYEYGEELDIVVKAHYSDGSDVEINNYTVSGYNAQNPGEQNLTVTYEGKTCNLKVLVNDPVLVNITAVSNKESYEYGEDLDIIVVANYSDGSQVTIDNYQVTGYNAENPGEQDLVVSYEDKTCNLKVLVNERVNKFPVDKLNSYLQLENIQTEVLAPIGYDAWEESTKPEQDGSKYFFASTKDEGTVGVDSIADQYAVALEAAGWTVEKDGNAYTATKLQGDAELVFETKNNLFSLRICSFVEFPDVKVMGSPIRVKTNIQDGDQVVIGNAAKGLIVSNYENETFKTESIKSDGTKLDGVRKDMMRFTINRTETGFTFSDIYGRKLGATGVGQVAFDEGSTEWTMVITSKSTLIVNANKEYGRLCIDLDGERFTTYASVSDGNLIYPQLFSLVNEDIIYPTAIELDGKQELASGKKNALNVEFVPENANALNEVTWSSSDSNIATVDQNGLVTAVALGQVTITATTKSKYATLETKFDIEVKDIVLDSWTIMLYICGADLESGSGLATMDIAEILKVDNQPEDVNIIMETGGSTSWHNYGIDANALSRYHVENKSIVLDEKLPKENMGKQSVFESFLNWGLQEYPAEKTGVVFWNHGGALDGVCFDSTVGGSNSLTNSETSKAFQNVFEANGIDKLEFVGYDACLMQIQDVAEFNSRYFNYQVGSEEAEAGEGWVYDKWIDDVYAGKSTPEILKANCDAFVAQYGDDQTLSYLDLSKMADYYTKFEAMAAAIKDTVKANYSSFKSLINTVKDFGGSWWSSGVQSYGEIDGMDFMNKLGNNAKYTSFQEKINEAKTAYSSLVSYSKKGSSAGQSFGLGIIAATYISYPASETSFTNWRSLFN